MILKKIFTISVLIFFLISFTACEQEGPAEKAGKKVWEEILIGLVSFFLTHNIR